MPAKDSHPYPDFIYNRFDLWAGDCTCETVAVPREDGSVLQVQVGCRDRVAYVGGWLMDLTAEELQMLCARALEAFPRAKRVCCQNVMAPLDARSQRGNHFKVVLPATPEELSARLSKKGRYNIKRERRLIGEQCGGCAFREYGLDAAGLAVIEQFFALKRRTHHTEYFMTPAEYAAKYHVTHIYTLEVPDRVLALMLSCEQTDIVYLENLSYDPDYARLSPGQVLYDEYLKRLIAKGKREVFLMGGEYGYKQRYDAVEQVVYQGVVYRNPLMQFIYHHVQPLYDFGHDRVRPFVAYHILHRDLD